MEIVGLRVAPSRALKEKRLAAPLAGREPADPVLADAVANAQVLGSLELAGFEPTWDEVKAARRGEPGSPAVLGLARAQRAVERPAPFSVAALAAWHAAAVGAPSSY